MRIAFGLKNNSFLHFSGCAWVQHYYSSGPPGLLSSVLNHDWHFTDCTPIDPENVAPLKFKRVKSDLCININFTYVYIFLFQAIFQTGNIVRFKSCAYDGYLQVWGLGGSVDAQGKAKGTDSKYLRGQTLSVRQGSYFRQNWASPVGRGASMCLYWTLKIELYQQLPIHQYFISFYLFIYNIRQARQIPIVQMN